MKHYTLARLLALAGMALFAGVQGSLAAPIKINNFSFERPKLGAGGWNNQLSDPDAPANSPDWLGQAGPNNGNAFIEFIGGFQAEGTQHLGMAGNYYVFQNTGVKFAPNTQYTLTVAIGNRNDNHTPAGAMTIIGLSVLNEAPGENNALAGSNANEQLDNDPVLKASAKIVDSEALTGINSTYADVTTTYTTGSNPPNGNIVIFLGDDASGGRSHFDNVRLDAVSVADPDGDKIPAEWETGTDRGVPRNLNPNVNDGAQDPDGDTLTNFQEFEKGTHPRLADTDGDGLKDNEETKTSPLLADSDGDTLMDGAEINTHKTDPLKADTDGDDFEDQAEVAAKTDPLVATAKPTDNGAITVGINFIGSSADGAGSSVTATAGVVPQANWNNASLGDGTGLSLKNAEGQPSLLRVSWKTNGPSVLNGTPAAGNGNDQLMHGLLLPREGGADSVFTTVTVKNLAYPSYDVYLYADSETGGDATYSVNGKSRTLSDAENWSFGGAGKFKEVVADGGEGNYTVFRGVTGSTLVIEVEPATNNAGGLNGIQIVRTLSVADPQLALGAAAIDFGTAAAAVKKAVKVTNNGKANTLNLTGATLTGADAARFAVGAVPATLAPGASADIEVTFNPPTTFGTYRATLEIKSNDSATPTAKVELSGKVEDTSPKLLGYWSADEGTGTTVKSSVKAAHNGTLSDGTWGAGHTTAATDKAFVLTGADGGGSQVEVPALENNFNQITITAWVKGKQTGDWTGLVQSRDGTQPIGIGYRGNTGQLTYTWNNNAPASYNFNSGLVIPQNEWAFLALTITPQRATLYVGAKGVLNSKSNNIAHQAQDNPDTPWHFGKDNCCGTARNFQGSMDDIAIFGAALSEDVIKAIFEGKLSPPQVTSTVAVPAPAKKSAKIIWAISNDPTSVNGTTGQEFVDLMKKAGHEVTVTPIPAAAPSAALLAQLNAADLIVMSRKMGSGDVNYPAWDGEVKTPLILMTAYVSRAVRWGWFTGDTLPDVSPTSVTANDPAHPVWKGITVANGASAAWHVPIDRNSSAPPVAEVGSGGKVIASFNGSVIVAEWPAGTAAVGKRMLFVGGSREPDGAAIGLAGKYDLTAIGQEAFLNAVSHMSGVPRDPGAGTQTGDTRASRITAISVQGGNASLSFTSEAGGSYDLETSTDLKTWTVLSSANATGGSTTVTGAAGGPVRFFRAKKK